MDFVLGMLCELNGKLWFWCGMIIRWLWVCWIVGYLLVIWYCLICWELFWSVRCMVCVKRCCLRMFLLNVLSVIIVLGIWCICLNLILRVVRGDCVIIRVWCGLCSCWDVLVWSIVDWWCWSFRSCMRCIKYFCAFGMFCMGLLGGKWIDFVLNISLCWLVCWVIYLLKNVCSSIGVELVLFGFLFDECSINWMCKSVGMFFRLLWYDN